MGTIYYTAQCDEKRICRHVTSSPTELVAPPGWTFVSLDKFDTSKIDQYWNGAFWEEIVK